MLQLSAATSTVLFSVKDGRGGVKVMQLNACSSVQVLFLVLSRLNKRGRIHLNSMRTMWVRCCFVFRQGAECGTTQGW